MRLRFLLTIVLLAAAMAAAQEPQLARVQRLLVDAFAEIRSENDQALALLTSSGLAPQDAERILIELGESVVACALDELRSVSGNQFHRRIDSMERLLDEGEGAKALAEMGMLVGANADACALVALQQAGISVEMLDQTSKSVEQDANELE